MIGTAYSTKAKGPRYLELTEGYINRIALDENNEIIGYEFANLGRMMEMVKAGKDANEASKKLQELTVDSMMLLSTSIQERNNRRVRKWHYLKVMKEELIKLTLH